MRCQRLAECGYTTGVTRLLARQRHGLHTGLVVIVREPCFGHDRISKIRFVEYLQTGALPMATQIVDHRVAARFGNACIQYFDHYINHCHRFGSLAPCRGHVPGKPLNCHFYLR